MTRRGRRIVSVAVLAAVVVVAAIWLQRDAEQEDLDHGPAGITRTE